MAWSKLWSTIMNQNMAKIALMTTTGPVYSEKILDPICTMQMYDTFFWFGVVS